ncbi:MAG: phosphoadenylyl-sulfate reductase [Halobacteria archaeon]
MSNKKTKEGRSYTEKELSKLNQTYVEMTAAERLNDGLDRFGEIVVASSFGLEDVAILDLVYDELERSPPVVFLDTLHHFQETLDLVDEFQEEYGLDLIVYTPKNVDTKQEFREKYGELWKTDVERYHQVTKLDQIERALEGRDAWVTGIRREQAVTRKEAQPVEWDENHGLVKLNPIYDWTRADVEEYVSENEVPYNPLHDQGYLSIGDEPLTEPVADNDDQRSGRWSDSDKTECGLHE